MARDHARIHHAIWSDPEFLALSGEAQRMYFVALTSPGLSYCGVVPLTDKRWAGQSSDGTVARVRKALAELERTRFVYADGTTQEVLIRTFVKHDGLLSSPNIVKAMVKAFPAIQSDPLRWAFLRELHRYLAEGIPDDWDKGWTLAQSWLQSLFPEGFPEGFLEPFSEGLDEGLDEELPEPFSRARSARDASRAGPVLSSPGPVPDFAARHLKAIRETLAASSKKGRPA